VNISFTVRHPSAILSISLRTTQGIVRKISGFPQSITWFQRQQGLDNPFRTPGHDLPRESLCLGCERNSVSQKRKADSTPTIHTKRTKLS
jgi:hypothetical protein